jgi:hypothetical protein
VDSVGSDLNTVLVRLDDGRDGWSVEVGDAGCLLMVRNDDDDDDLIGVDGDCVLVHWPWLMVVVVVVVVAGRLEKTLWLCISTLPSAWVVVVSVMVSRRPSEWIMVRVLVDMEVANGCCCEYSVVDLSLRPQDGCDEDEGEDLTFCWRVTGLAGIRVTWIDGVPWWFIKSGSSPNSLANIFLNISIGSSNPSGVTLPEYENKIGVSPPKFMDVELHCGESSEDEVVYVYVVRLGLLLLVVPLVVV